jgi:hypothetical protein
MNQPELDLFNDKLEAHAREVERFHGEVANVTRQIANCDKLVRLANAGLSQIDSKIAEASGSAPKPSCKPTPPARRRRRRPPSPRKRL